VIRQSKRECETSTKLQKEAIQQKRLHCKYSTNNKTKETASWNTGTVLMVHGVGNHTSQELSTLGQIIASVLSLDIDETRQSDAGHW
jgi:hypothetical protein